MDSETNHSKRWQAEIWSGESSEALTLTRVYGPSLDALREAAREFLLERRPACFSNLCVGSLLLRHSPGLRETTLSIYRFAKIPGGTQDLVPEPGPRVASRRKHVRGRHGIGAKPEAAHPGEAVASMGESELSFEELARLLLPGEAVASMGKGEVPPPVSALKQETQEEGWCRENEWG